MTTVQTFDELALIAPLHQAIADLNYSTPTPIQSMAIPPILAGRDLLGIAQTGTGKTAAFALPIMQRLAADKKPAPRKGCRVLVLSPTRELATQIGESFRLLGKHLGTTVAVVFGGVSHRPQINALARGVDVLIATPGRLLDHVAERNCVLGATEVLVLDEADQMLDLGFFKPIRRIVAQLPSKRQSLFFSATMPGEIEALTKELLTEPVKVAVTPTATTVELIDQRVILIEANRKRALLAELLADAGMSRTLVFTRTKRGADRVAKHLDGAGIEVSAIHGNKSQHQREAALEAFKDGNIRVLVATDIAARGIDVDKVSHVVNYELPEVPEAYVHRIGRTARAGASGIAISLCANDERGLLRDIERLTRQTIAAQDRRNDKGLEADAPGTSERPRGERGRGERGRGEGARGHGQRDGAQRGHGERGQRRGGRPSYGERANGADRAHGPRPPREERVQPAGGQEQREHRRDDRRPQQARPHGTGDGARRHGEGRPHHGNGERRHNGSGQQRSEGRDDRRGSGNRDRGERAHETRHRNGPHGGQSYWETGIVDQGAREAKPEREARAPRPEQRPLRSASGARSSEHRAPRTEHGGRPEHRGPRSENGRRDDRRANEHQPRGNGGGKPGGDRRPDRARRDSTPART